MTTPFRLIGDHPSINQVLQRYIESLDRGKPSQLNAFNLIAELGFMPDSNINRRRDILEANLNKIADVGAAIKRAFKHRTDHRIFMNYLFAEYGEKVKVVGKLRHCSKRTAEKWIERKKDRIIAELDKINVITSSRELRKYENKA